ncbi:MAG: hypothetical protein R2838_20005 [Caldilineaceae bacterium]
MTIRTTCPAHRRECRPRSSSVTVTRTNQAGQMRDHFFGNATSVAPTRAVSMTVP